MEETMKQFVFILDDEGLIKYILVDSDITRLAGSAVRWINHFLGEYGYSHETDDIPQTEDGFVHIYETISGETKSAEPIWTYKFDGDETPESAMERLIPGFNKAQQLS